MPDSRWWSLCSLLFLLGAGKRITALSLVKTCQSDDESVKDEMSLPADCAAAFIIQTAGNNGTLSQGRGSPS